MTTTAQPTRAADAIARYSRTVHAAAPEGHHIASPFGAWLVLALAGLARVDDPADRASLTDALGMPPEDAGRVAADLLRTPHPAVAAAVGLWWRADRRTDRLAAYLDRLPRNATREPLSDQETLDAWAREHTLGLIEQFPVRATADLVLVLASALATKVRWFRPFAVVPSAELGEAGFAASVAQALRSVPGHDVRMVRTSVGLVGAHVAASGDGLAVVSVLGPPDADRAAVLAAAHEVALGLRRASVGEHVSLFDLPLGAGEIGEIVEDIVEESGSRPVERGIAVLPSWRASTGLDLRAGPTGAAFDAAGRLLAELLPPGDAVSFAARQVAVASYTREGFEAAAITGIGIATSFRMPRQLPRRTLTLRFDRPYAAVAVAVEPPPMAEPPPVAEPWFGLPVFSAWVAEPAES